MFHKTWHLPFRNVTHFMKFTPPCAKKWGDTFMAVCGPFSHYSMTHEAFGIILVSMSLFVFHSEPQQNHCWIWFLLKKGCFSKWKGRIELLFHTVRVVEDAWVKAGMCVLMCSVLCCEFGVWVLDTVETIQLFWCVAPVCWISGLVTFLLISQRSR